MLQIAKSGNTVPVELAVRLAPGAKTAGGELNDDPGCSIAILSLILRCCLLKLMTWRKMNAYSAKAPKTRRMQASSQISRAVTALATGIRALWSCNNKIYCQNKCSQNLCSKSVSFYDLHVWWCGFMRLGWFFEQNPICGFDPIPAQRTNPKCFLRWQKWLFSPIIRFSYQNHAWKNG